MTKTLKEIYPLAYEELSKTRPNIAGMMDMFTQCTDMDKVLGYTGAVGNWMNLKNVPSPPAEANAKNYLAGLRKTIVNNTKEVPSLVQKTIVSEPEQEMTYLISFPKSKLTKVITVLTMLGCDSVEL